MHVRPKVGLLVIWLDHLNELLEVLALGRLVFDADPELAVVDPVTGLNQNAHCVSSVITRVRAHAARKP